MEKKYKNLKDNNLKKKIQKIIDKSKELNLIKPLSSAFENTSCEVEEHKGKKQYLCK